MGVVIKVNGDKVFEQEGNVPMIHVMTPTGESATIRSQSGDFGADYMYEIDLVLDPAQGGIYLDEVEHEERLARREKLEGQEVAGTNRNNMGVSQEELDANEAENQARLQAGQNNPNGQNENADPNAPKTEITL